MASASQSSQHRCVFVGNIPYDATEEQLKQICEEVGPVVHFRLVIDRETGKPKGYGFCEYKDEETALSARRNLQGYEINGRQLRVDFAENDKNADRNREQGRGGPGMVSNADSQRQFRGLAAAGDSSFYQPMGDKVAVAAATAMARALGAAQTSSLPNQINQQSYQALGSDPLTVLLAKMSRNQLSEIMSELKTMATQNKEQARQILLALPNLPKAIFQAQFMLGMVTQQMLQMPNVRQGAGLQQSLLLDAQGSQQAVQAATGLPPLPPSTQGLCVHPSSSVPSQQAAAVLQYSAYNQTQPTQNQNFQQSHLPLQSGISTLPSVRPQPPSSLAVRPHIQAGPSSSFKQQAQVSLPQHSGPTIISGYNPMTFPRPSLPDQSLQENGKLTNDGAGLINRPSKLMRLNDGRSATASVDMNMVASSSGQLANSSASIDQISKMGAAPSSEQQVAQVQLPPDVEFALLQQVLSLTPEQLRSLPPDQQQQVIQLQQQLRQST